MTFPCEGDVRMSERNEGFAIKERFERLSNAEGEFCVQEWVGISVCAFKEDMTVDEGVDIGNDSSNGGG